MARDKYRELAYKYAPIFAQKVSNEWPVADQIAPVDFAGSIARVAQNPRALHSIKKKEENDYVIPAKVYYSICETTTHYFLIYAIYHVLDWWKRYKPRDLYNTIRDMLDEHIHDMEGALLVVTKGQKGLKRGEEKSAEVREERVDGLVTVAHNNFYLYTEPRIPTGDGKWKEVNSQKLRVAKFNETVDGHIWLDRATERVKLYVESRGHGIRGDHKHWGGGDEIWYYYPKEKSVSPAHLDLKERETTRTVSYELEDIFAAKGLWAHRFNNRVFMQNKDGKWAFVYRGEDRKLHGGAANPPWSWNDHNDPSPMGEIATDPARVIIRYAQGWGPVSTHYIYNPYQSIGVSA